MYAPVVCIAGALMLLGGLFPVEVGFAQDSAADIRQKEFVVDDSEDDELGSFPEGWVFVESDENIKGYEETKEPGRTVVVREEGETGLSGSLRRTTTSATRSATASTLSGT